MLNAKLDCTCNVEDKGAFAFHLSFAPDTVKVEQPAAKLESRTYFILAAAASVQAPNDIRILQPTMNVLRCLVPSGEIDANIVALKNSLQIGAFRIFVSINLSFFFYARWRRAKKTQRHTP